MPQRVAGALPQPGHAVPQRLSQPRRGLLGRPRLVERVRRRLHRLVELGFRDRGPGHRLHQRVQLDGPGGAGRVDGDQPGPGQVVHRFPCVPRVGGHGRVPAEVTAGGRAGEDDARDAGRVEQRGQRQHRPGGPGRGDLVGQVDGQGPGDVGDAGGGGRGPRPGQRVGFPGQRAGAGQPLPAVVEPAAVVAAAAPGADHRGGGVAQRQRLAVQVGGQVESLGALSRVGGQPRGQVGQRLPHAERADPGDTAVRRGQAVIPPGGDQHPAVRAAGPQAVQVGWVGQVVQDHQPAALGAGQPGQEAPGGGRQVVVRVRGAQVGEGQRVGVEDGLPAGRADPDEQVDPAGVPQRVRQRGGELGLAAAAERGLPR